MLRPLRWTGIPLLAQRWATETGWLRYFAIAGQPVRVSGVPGGFVFLFVRGLIFFFLHTAIWRSCVCSRFRFVAGDLGLPPHYLG